MAQIENASCIFAQADFGVAAVDGGGVHICAAARQRSEGGAGDFDQPAGELHNCGAGDWIADSVRVGICPANGNVDGNVADLRAL